MTAPKGWRPPGYTQPTKQERKRWAREEKGRRIFIADLKQKALWLMAIIGGIALYNTFIGWGLR